LLAASPSSVFKLLTVSAMPAVSLEYIA
jgi:hypothetical protein